MEVVEDKPRRGSILSNLTAEPLPPKATWKTRIKSWLLAPIDNDQHLLEYELIALALSTGIIDALAFPKFHCFVSNQTGNTVLFAISTFSLIGTRQESDFLIPIPQIATSLGCFCAGVFFAGQVANYLQCRFIRWWLLLSNIIQTALVLASAILNIAHRTGDYLSTNSETNSSTIIGTVAMLAFASGMQVALSRQLGMPEIPTTQATAAYVDLLVDPNFFVPVADERGRGRNRRIAFLVTLVIGSFIGAPAYKYVNAGFTILLGAIVKAIVTIVFCLNRCKREMVTASA